MPTCSIIDSFVAPGCEGNRHTVLLCDDVEQALAQHREEQHQLPAGQRPQNIFVFLQSALSSKEDPLPVRFYQQGAEILRCGSGSLAAAHVLAKQRPEQPLFRLGTRAGTVRVGSVAGYSFYQAAILPIRGMATDPSAASKTHWQRLIDRDLKAVSLLGDGRGYVLLELPDAEAVRRCRVHARRSCITTRRAIIVTALTDRPAIANAPINAEIFEQHQTPAPFTGLASTVPRYRAYDYVMRYFRPQYGQYEDAATGSANAMLGHYWQRRLHRNQVRGRQLSAAGAVFLVQRQGQQQRVYGHTREA